MGAWIAYEVGRSEGRAFLRRWGGRFGIHEREIARAEELFERHGEAMVMISRVIPLVRAYISYPAGAARMNRPRFLAFTVIGSVPFVILLVYLGTVLGPGFRRLQAYFGLLDILVVVAVVALGLALVGGGAGPPPTGASPALPEDAAVGPPVPGPERPGPRPHPLLPVGGRERRRGGPTRRRGSPRRRERRGRRPARGSAGRSGGRRSRSRERLRRGIGKWNRNPYPATCAASIRAMPGIGPFPMSRRARKEPPGEAGALESGTAEPRRPGPPPSRPSGPRRSSGGARRSATRPRRWRRGRGIGLGGGPRGRSPPVHRSRRNPGRWKVPTGRPMYSPPSTMRRPAR